MQLNNNPNNTETIAFFDDFCVLCNKSVAFILKWEKNNQLKFSGIHSGKSRFPVLNKYESADTIILMEGDKVFIKSTAVLRLCRYLRGAFPIFQILLLIPVKIRDFIYDYIASKRYQWFGIVEKCIVLTEDTKDRFI